MLSLSFINLFPSFVLSVRILISIFHLCVFPIIGHVILRPVHSTRHHHHHCGELVVLTQEALRLRRSVRRWWHRFVVVVVVVV